MSRRLLTVFAFLCSLSALRAESWSLAAAVAEARAASPDAAVARERVNAARAVLAQASAADWPQLTLKAGYIQTNNPMQAFGAILNQGVFSSSIDFNTPGQVDNFNATATLGYSLYTGGRATAGKAAARSASEAAELDRAAALEQLDAEVARAYFQIRQAREAVGAMESAVRALEASAHVAQLRFESGQLLRSEVLNIAVQLAQTRERLLEAQHQSALADRYFLYLLGREGTAAVELAPDDATAAAFTAPDQPTIARRPELEAMRRRVSAAEKLVAVARAARRPSVNAFASYQHDQGWRLDGDGRSWMAGVQAEVSLFDGPLTGGRIRQAEAELAQAREGLRKLQLALGLQLEQAQLAHRLAGEQLEVTSTLVAQAAEAARISRERFESGSLLTAELIGVETRLTEAHMRRSIALANERITAVDLRRAAGLPLLSL